MTFLLAAAAVLLSAVPIQNGVLVLVNDTRFILDAREAKEEGTLAAHAWLGVGVVNPGAAPASVTLSLHCDGEGIEDVQLELPAGGRRVIRIDRLFAASVDGCEIGLRSWPPVLMFGYADDAQGGIALTPAGVVRPRRRRSVRSPSPPQLVPQTVILPPAKDNTLYESADGSLSNGAGIHLFAGATGSRSLRRALLAFDVTSRIPPGSQVTRVVLTLRISQQASLGPDSMTLHRVSANWGEGSSNAGSSQDGDGAASRPGDATWVHTFFPDLRWSAAGGDFDAAADATAQTVIDTIIWESPAMIARVQHWLDQPSTNFGWIAIGNETTFKTAKRFDSREVLPETARPALTIEFSGRP